MLFLVKVCKLLIQNSKSTSKLSLELRLLSLALLRDLMTANIEEVRLKDPKMSPAKIDSDESNIKSIKKQNPSKKRRVKREKSGS